MSWYWEKFCLILVGIILGVCAVLVFYPPSRLWPSLWLYEKSPDLDKADAIVLMMGDVADRTPVAARLWKQKAAPKIIFMETEQDELAKLNLRPTDSELTHQYLKKLAIPEEAILYNKSTAVSSTREEVEAIIKTLDSKLPQARHILVVTSWYHSSRTMWVIHKNKLKNTKLRFYSVPSPLPSLWYGREKDFLSVFTEYLKWTYYLMSPSPG